MASALLHLPIIDLASTDRLSTANSIRQACTEHGFFYLINHGVEEELLNRVFDESKKFFSLPLEEKMRLARREHRGYTPLYAEKLDPSLGNKGKMIDNAKEREGLYYVEGDSKESFYIGPLGSISSYSDLNQWPSEEALPSWRSIMETYYEGVMAAGKRLMSLISLALNLDEDFFEKIGAFNQPMPLLRLLHYPGELGLSDEEIYGASAHSDYGMITILATDGIAGLQICREKSKQPQVWEDVHHVKRAFIVNIGDLTERWTNCLFRSTLHRVMPTGQERYSIAFFLDPNPDCVVECLKSCCSDLNPPRFPPIRSGDYLKERFRLTYGS
ncbi:2-oxoglutarate-Fe(II) type oxidoreductase hxnY isoform X2 [Diospyros lotus]|uniref:2-oxoglutarate-Fe(II) type oxidoreductase hxnY isoform X2 n=1 Tax=Diospyros lotus TaxID=55363 RepID=UPI00225B7638|nr:2-oxoglutarate-Fe(II) type oxidoreductase hxnY isoform X2 [Diospyros lotus]